MKSRMTMHVFLGMMGLFLAPALVVGQTVSGSVGRTPYGHPDFQGLWTNSTTTPLERPDRVADQAVYSDEEVAAIDAANVGRNDRLPPSGDPGTYNDFWWERGTALTRTSLVVDPPEGRLPERTMAGDVRARWSRGVDSWTERSLAERCVTRGAPKRPGGYNNNFLVLQTEDYVVMLQEMIHEPRIIPLDGRPPVDERIRLWMGDSRGRWEGDTLVVETTRYRDDIYQNSFNCCPGASAGLTLIERFRRVDVGTIEHQYTVIDPDTYTSPWTASIPMRRFPGPIYEYACHEGNYGMENLLRGGRVQEPAGP
jgi:hypothetical protein